MSFKAFARALPLEQTSHAFHFEIKQDSRHQRLNALFFNEDVLNKFLSDARQYSLDELKFSPLLRCKLAQILMDLTDPQLGFFIKAIINDPSLGALVVKIPSAIRHDQDDLIRLSTAVIHSIGFCQIDHASQAYFHVMNLRHANSEKFTVNVMAPYKPLHLHTDGVFAPITPDFLLMGKIKEVGVSGGHSRLLHIEDFEQLNYFRTHPQCKTHYYHQGGKDYNALYKTRKPLFNLDQNVLKWEFNFSTTIPESFSDAKFVLELHQALETSSGVAQIPLEVSELIILNNNRWLHGRQEFAVNENLDRTLFRMRGMFWENHSVNAATSVVSE